MQAVTETQEQAFDAAAYDLPIPKDRYGRKADKLVVQLGAFEVDRTSEDDLDTFDAIEKGRFVELRVRAFVIEAAERSKEGDDGEQETEFKRVLRVIGVEKA